METTITRSQEWNDKSQHDKNVKIITDAISRTQYKECYNIVVIRTQ
jgi:hypothetical protein